MGLKVMQNMRFKNSGSLLHANMVTLILTNGENEIVFIPVN